MHKRKKENSSRARAKRHLNRNCSTTLVCELHPPGSWVGTSLFVGWHSLVRGLARVCLWLSPPLFGGLHSLFVGCTPDFWGTHCLWHHLVVGCTPLVCGFAPTRLWIWGGVGCVGCGGVRCPRPLAPDPLSRSHLRSFSSLWGSSRVFFSLWRSSRGILVVLVGRDPQMCAFSPFVSLTPVGSFCTPRWRAASLVCGLQPWLSLAPPCLCALLVCDLHPPCLWLASPLFAPLPRSGAPSVCAWHPLV